MLIKDIVARINRKLAGERHTYSELQDSMDAVIDDINSDLNTIFPAFSELSISASAYIAIPDKYIRSVIVPGVATKYFAIDEEGLDVTPAFTLEYATNRFLMIRDYFSQVPVEYRNNTGNQGTLGITVEDAGGLRGVEIDGSYFHN